MIKNFISSFLANRKKVFIQIKKDTYNLIVINRNLLLSKNKKSRLKNKITTSYNLKVL